uniref:Uncharacterized protein n=1 Tax=Paulinella micropora TaxID=1928728 RepID=A0A385HZZ4_9EUKA|nr:hypothetical protein PMNZ_292 [Paulinella micropora]AXY63237.1 hypothetical protein PMNZ_292 [Paulinella micropora]
MVMSIKSWNFVILESWFNRLKVGLERIMVMNVFILIVGSLYFLIAITLHFQHFDSPLNLFQKLWEPLFAPSINLLFIGIVANFGIKKWQRQFNNL